MKPRCFHCESTENLKRCRCQGRDRMFCPACLKTVRMCSTALNREYRRIIKPATLPR